MEEGISVIEEIIRSYPKLSQKLRYLKSCSTVRRRGAKLYSDPTVEGALAELPPEEQRRYDAITSAIIHTGRFYENGAKRMLVIRSTYWDASFDVEALKQISALDAQEFRQDFIQAVSQRLGLNKCTDCVHWRKLFSSNRANIYACLYCYDTGRPRRYAGSQCYSKCVDREASNETSL